MTRYILMDSYSGYIWGDKTAVSPCEAAKLVDANANDYDKSYYDHGPNSRPTESHYLVYEVPEDFPEVVDGQDQELIDELDRRGSLVAKVTWEMNYPMLDEVWQVGASGAE